MNNVGIVSVIPAKAGIYPEQDNEENSVNLGNLSTSAPTYLNTNIEVSFEHPQRAITPGQVCVFYDGDTVL